MRGAANVAEFVEPALVPAGPVRITAFDGENADPANGRAMGEGVLAHTPWGEIAYALAGRAGYERGARERRASGGARRRDPAGAVRRRAGPDPARRALGVPAQGAPLRRRPRPVDRLPDLAVQGGGGGAERGAGLHPRDRQGRAGRRCVQRGEPVHRRPDGGGGERVGAQGDAAQPDRGGRDDPGPAPAPVRGDRPGEGPGRNGRLPEPVDGARGIALHRGRPPRNRGGVPRKLSPASRGAGDPDRQDRDAGQLPARARHVAVAGAHRLAPVGAPARGRHRDPSPPRRPGPRADPPGDRDAAPAVRFHPGDCAGRGGGGVGSGGSASQTCPRTGDRRRAPPRDAALCGVRRADDPDAHLRVQRPAQGAVAGAAPLLGAGAGPWT